MWSAKIYDLRNQLVLGNLEPTAPPADYFAGCVQILISLFNGGSDFYHLLQQVTGKSCSVTVQQAPSASLAR